MAEPKLISMKRSAADKRKDQGEVAPISSIAPDYPYGLTIHMDGDELDKLGFKDLPDVGTEIPMEILVKVTCVRQSASDNPGQGYYEQRCVDFQITDMAVDTAKD
ncbi:MAG TPA: hypothetical protein VE251_00895 [Xanthobacteraceae bacterium]|jgi:hypothetical protein|nr:hypothetical protein [Xanthobacteraceae bacterium]